MVGWEECLQGDLFRVDLEGAFSQSLSIHHVLLEAVHILYNFKYRESFVFYYMGRGIHG